MEAENIIREIIEILVEEYKPEKIILFGSYAYGNPTEDSDIDLLIIKETNKRRIDRFVEVGRILSSVESEFKIPISPLVLTEKELKERIELGDDFIEEIMTRGELVYERKTCSGVV